MAKVCEVCGRGPQFGNRISHAHNVTKRRWNVNLQSVRALVKGAGRRLRVCTSCIRSGKSRRSLNVFPFLSFQVITRYGKVKVRNVGW